MVRRVLSGKAIWLGIGLVSLVSFLVLAYLWVDYSEEIDRRLLGGEVFTRSSGIYSAPKQIRKGDSISRSDLVMYLRAAGSVSKSEKADPSRSRHSIRGNTVEIETGETSRIDGRQEFPSLRIDFDSTGRAIRKISEIESGKEVVKAFLEPRLLIAPAGEGDGRRRVVTFEDLPEHLVDAITVTEDRSFFDHYGVNIRGILRAMWRRYESAEDDSPLSRQGGSSITQQLVKNLLLSSEQTIQRKLKEAYMSLILETRLDKKEIFTLYANQIYLGQQGGLSIYGVGEAAEVYFGKNVNQLTLGESALIAGIIRSPNRYNVSANPDRGFQRRNQVLQSMTEAGKLDQSDADRVKASKLTLRKTASSADQDGLAYFSQYVLDQMPALVSDPEAIQHLRIYTSIDPDLQKKANEVLARRVMVLESRVGKRSKSPLNAALISIRPKTGEIVAMVGGKSFSESQFNRAVNAKRQPGSVFKPFVYAAAINSPYDAGIKVMTAATMLKDEKKTFQIGSDTYSPSNFGESFTDREMSLRDALVQSKNVITVELGQELGMTRVMNLAARFGYPRVERAYASMALGTAEATPLQVAESYSVFANLGERVTPRPVVRITTGDGRTVGEPTAVKLNVIRPNVAFIINDILRETVDRGTAARLAEWGLNNSAGKGDIAGKTGSSRDGWFVGYTPELLTVVYVGFDDGTDIGMTGSESAMPIWADYMREALRLRPEFQGSWEMPMGLKRAEIDRRDGSLIREFSDVEELQGVVDGNTSQSVDDSTEDRGFNRPLAPNQFKRIELFIVGTVPIGPSFRPPSPDEEPLRPEDPPTGARGDDDIQ
jgi:penicillin-binding protein 1B